MEGEKDGTKVQEEQIIKMNATRNDGFHFSGSLEVTLGKTAGS